MISKKWSDFFFFYWVTRGIKVFADTRATLNFAYPAVYVCYITPQVNLSPPLLTLLLFVFLLLCAFSLSPLHYYF